ncbi:MAG: undecaprenyldiphospho-muramoylpentapeptide beta-N-acetylglucosaminyltransferase [Alphaproteobacteria bacterium]
MARPGTISSAGDAEAGLDRSVSAAVSLGGGTVVLAAGGTAGHLFPAQALAEALKAKGARIVLITDKRGQTYARDFPADQTVLVDAATFAGRGLLGKVGAILSILVGITSAWRRLGALRPAIVIGFGGYPSLPAMVGALVRGVPTIIHEQNVLLGRVNRLIGGRVTAVASAFDGLEGGGAEVANRVVVTGNPVRERVAARRQDPYRAPAEDGPIRLVVFGGSQGARVMGTVVPAALAMLPDRLRARLRVTQQCREEDQARVAETYRDAGIEADLSTFILDMDQRLSSAHLVIARAGASTITELAVVGRPGLLVPLPGAMDDHQTVNAQLLEQAGAAWRIQEPDFTPSALAAQLTDLFDTPDTLAGAAERARGLGRHDATDRLVALVTRLARLPRRAPLAASASPRGAE